MKSNWGGKDTFRILYYQVQFLSHNISENQEFKYC